MHDAIRAELAHPMPDNLLDRRELAARLGVCTRTIERYLRQVPGFPKPTRSGRWSSSPRLWVEADVSMAQAVLDARRNGEDPASLMALLG